MKAVAICHISSMGAWGRINEGGTHDNSRAKVFCKTANQKEIYQGFEHEKKSGVKRTQILILVRGARSIVLQRQGKAHQTRNQ